MHSRSFIFRLLLVILGVFGALTTGAIGFAGDPLTLEQALTRYPRSLTLLKLKEIAFYPRSPMTAQVEELGPPFLPGTLRIRMTRGTPPNGGTKVLELDSYQRSEPRPHSISEYPPEQIANVSSDDPVHGAHLLASLWQAHDFHFLTQALLKKNDPDIEVMSNANMAFHYKRPNPGFSVAQLLQGVIQRAFEESTVSHVQFWEYQSNTIFIPDASPERVKTVNIPGDVAEVRASIQRHLETHPELKDAELPGLKDEHATMPQQRGFRISFPAPGVVQLLREGELYYHTESMYLNNPEGRTSSFGFDLVGGDDGKFYVKPQYAVSADQLQKDSEYAAAFQLISQIVGNLNPAQSEIRFISGNSSITVRLVSPQLCEQELDKKTKKPARRGRKAAAR